jgi:hypothetical protein
MKNNNLQSMLREVFRRLAAKPTLIAYIAIVTVCVIAGPFTTFEKLNLIERIAYWGFVLAGCFMVAIGVQTVADRAPWSRASSNKSGPSSAWSRLFFISLVNGTLIAGLVYGVNNLVWGTVAALPTFWTYLAMTIPISAVVALTVTLLRKDDYPPQMQNSKFLERLPNHLGSQLYSITATDHYVHAVTAKGSHLVFMRFSDALTELETIPGIRIHRSHWVAEDAITGVAKVSGKMVVKLPDGKSLPVSRGRLAEVKSKLNV